MTHLNRRALLAAVALMGISGLSGPAMAQSYPSEVIHLVVPYGPGGGTDLTARIVADELAKRKGWNVVVDNKPGAASQIGVSFVARAKPDGYTILWSSADGLVVIPAVEKNVAYKVPEDFEFITTFASFPLVLAVSKDLPVSNFAELIDYAKAHPGELNYSSSGTGGGGHLHPAAMWFELGLDMVHIPYDGAGPAVVAVAGGHADMTNVAPSSAAPYAADGSVKVLVTSGEARTQMFPDVPTLAEAGYPQFTLDFFYGMYAPAGTPKEITETLREAVAEIRNDPEIQKGLLEKGLAPFERNGDGFRSFVESQVQRWTKVAKEINFSSN